MTIFILPKKLGTMRLLKDYYGINKQLVQNPHPMTVIYNTKKQLKWLQYATTLDFSMEYYTIQLFL